MLGKHKIETYIWEDIMIISQLSIIFEQTKFLHHFSTKFVFSLTYYYIKIYCEIHQNFAPSSPTTVICRIFVQHRWNISITIYFKDSLSSGFIIVQLPNLTSRFCSTYVVFDAISQCLIRPSLWKNKGCATGATHFSIFK